MFGNTNSSAYPQVCVPWKGLKPSVSVSRFEWKNRDQKVIEIESLHSPEKDAILYVLKSEDSRDNQVRDLYQVNSSLGSKINVSNTDIQ